MTAKRGPVGVVGDAHRVGEAAGVQWGIDHAWSDDIDTDAVATPVDRQPTAELEHRTFRRHVCHLTRHRHR